MFIFQVSPVLAIGENEVEKQSPHTQVNPPKQDQQDTTIHKTHLEYGFPNISLEKMFESDKEEPMAPVIEMASTLKEPQDKQLLEAAIYCYELVNSGKMHPKDAELTLSENDIIIPAFTKVEEVKNDDEISYEISVVQLKPEENDYDIKTFNSPIKRPVTGDYIFDAKGRAREVVSGFDKPGMVVASTGNPEGFIKNMEEQGYSVGEIESNTWTTATEVIKRDGIEDVGDDGTKKTPATTFANMQKRGDIVVYDSKTLKKRKNQRIVKKGDIVVIKSDKTKDKHKQINKEDEKDGRTDATPRESTDSKTSQTSDEKREDDVEIRQRLPRDKLGATPPENSMYIAPDYEDPKVSLSKGFFISPKFGDHVADPMNPYSGPVNTIPNEQWGKVDGYQGVTPDNESRGMKDARGTRHLAGGSIYTGMTMFNIKSRNKDPWLISYSIDAVQEVEEPQYLGTVPTVTEYNGWNDPDLNRLAIKTWKESAGKGTVPGRDHGIDIVDSEIIGDGAFSHGLAEMKKKILLESGVDYQEFKKEYMNDNTQATINELRLDDSRQMYNYANFIGNVLYDLTQNVRENGYTIEKGLGDNWKVYGSYGDLKLTGHETAAGFQVNTDIKAFVVGAEYEIKTPKENDGYSRLYMGAAGGAGILGETNNIEITNYNVSGYGFRGQSTIKGEHGVVPIVGLRGEYENQSYLKTDIGTLGFNAEFQTSFLPFAAYDGLATLSGEYEDYFGGTPLDKINPNEDFLAYVPPVDVTLSGTYRPKGTELDIGPVLEFSPLNMGLRKIALRAEYSKEGENNLYRISGEVGFSGGDFSYYSKSYYPDETTTPLNPYAFANLDVTPKDWESGVKIKAFAKWNRFPSGESAFGPVSSTHVFSLGISFGGVLSLGSEKPVKYNTDTQIHIPGSDTDIPYAGFTQETLEEVDEKSKDSAGTKGFWNGAHYYTGSAINTTLTYVPLVPKPASEFVIKGVGLGRPTHASMTGPLAGKESRDTDDLFATMEQYEEKIDIRKRTVIIFASEHNEEGELDGEMMDEIVENNPNTTFSFVYTGDVVDKYSEHEYEWMKELARRSGGEFIELDEEAKDVIAEETVLTLQSARSTSAGSLRILADNSEPTTDAFGNYVSYPPGNTEEYQFELIPMYFEYEDDFGIDRDRIFEIPDDDVRAKSLERYGIPAPGQKPPEGTVAAQLIKVKRLEDMIDLKYPSTVFGSTARPFSPAWFSERPGVEQSDEFIEFEREYGKLIDMRTSALEDIAGWAEDARDRGQVEPEYTSGERAEIIEEAQEDVADEIFDEIDRPNRMIDPVGTAKAIKKMVEKAELEISEEDIEKIKEKLEEFDPEKQKEIMEKVQKRLEEEAKNKAKEMVKSKIPGIDIIEDIFGGF